MQFLPSSLPKLRLPLLLGLSVALLPGCKDREAQPAAPGQTAADAAYATEEAFPGRSGTTRQGTFLGQTITYEEIDGRAVFEGDIFLSPEQLRGETAEGGRSGQTEGAVRKPMVNRWPNRLVPYTIAPGLTNPSRVADAIAHWEANTNLRFQVRAGESNYVTFTPGPGCGSSVGRVGGQQFITLSPSFTVGNAIHEIGHAVGLLHEHTRLDRDSYVTIHWNNIQPGKADYFKKYNQVGYIGADVRSFDFNSRMLLGTRAYAFDPTKSTITKTDGSTYAINTTSLSAGDIATVNDLYPPPFVPVPGKARNIAAGANGDVYIIGTATIKDSLFKGYEVFKWTSAGWSKLPIAAVDIDVDANNQPWIVNAQHEIWRFNGTAWEQVPGWARGIGAGAQGAVHIVSNIPALGGYYLQRWTGTQWESVIGGRGGVDVEVDYLGRPWAVTGTGELWLYAGNAWSFKSADASHVGIGGAGSLFVLGKQVAADGNHTIYKLTGTYFHSLPQSGKAVKIAATGAGTAWIVTASNEIFRYK
jgi:hypothetical protein